MGSISTTLFADRDITIKTIEGVVSFKNVQQWVREFYQESVTRNIIWDFTGASIIDLRSQDVKRIFHFTRQFIPDNSKGKAALVVASEHGLGLSKIYKTHHDLSAHNVEHRIFRKFQDALEWIESSE
ncbi:hypothetical protein KKF84_21830 [Myxococcota bacterium]|nr:hypothetical protein [Myxococcota bacterium]MBU1537968.1 hypothetical protein [Myxococcota bacterium]